MLGVGNQLSVGWMIDCFHSENDLHQFGIVLVDVFDQLVLGICWSRNEHLASVGNRISDLMKEIVVF